MSEYFCDNSECPFHYPCDPGAREGAAIINGKPVISLRYAVQQTDLRLCRACINMVEIYNKIVKERIDGEAQRGNSQNAG